MTETAGPQAIVAESGKAVTREARLVTDHQQENRSTPVLVRKFGVICTPLLDYREGLALVTNVRAQFPKLAVYEARADGKEHVLKNGTGLKLEDEWLLKIEGDEVSVAWGSNISRHEGESLVTHVVDQIVAGSGALRISKFDFIVARRIISGGNHYEWIAKAFFAGTSMNTALARVQEKYDASLGDDDLRVLLFFGPDKTGSVQVRGTTTKKEIQKGEFERDTIAVTFGILQDKTSQIADGLKEALLQHTKLVEEIFEGVITPHIVQPLLDAIAAGPAKSSVSPL